MSYPRFAPSEYGAHCVSVFEGFQDVSPPEREVVAAYLTILSQASKLYDVGIAAWCMMTDHKHTFVFDRNPERPSQVPQFRRYVNSVFAQWLNHWWDSNGSWFERNALPQQISVIDVEKERQQICYIETNFLAAGVLDPEKVLAGAVSTREQLLRPLVIPRPKEWFQARTWPAVAKIQLEVPPCAQREGFNERSYYFRTKLDHAEAQMAGLNKLLEEGVTFRRAEELQDLKPGSPKYYKVNHSLVPCTGTHAHDRSRFVGRKYRHRAAYYRSLGKVKKNLAGVRFPWGTDKMVNQYGFKISRRPG